MMNEQMNANRDLAERIGALARPVVASMGLELVEVVYRGGLPSGFLRLVIDKPGGVSLDDCEAVSRVVGTQLDVEGLVAQSYTLEVTSPGLDRQLRQPDEYDKYRGRLARIKMAGQVLVGRLEGLVDGDVMIRLDHGEVQRVPMRDVREARLVVEFGRDPAAHTAAGRRR